MFGRESRLSILNASGRFMDLKEKNGERRQAKIASTSFSFDFCFDLTFLISRITRLSPLSAEFRGCEI